MELPNILSNTNFRFSDKISLFLIILNFCGAREDITQTQLYCNMLDIIDAVEDARRRVTIREMAVIFKENLDLDEKVCELRKSYAGHR